MIHENNNGFAPKRKGSFTKRSMSYLLLFVAVFGRDEYKQGSCEAA